jgi:general secretion pathway protein A
VLRIILAGQPELNQKLDDPGLEQLAQRVRLRFHLQNLTEAETQSYVQHRLDVAGAGDRELFSADTFPVIFRYSGGVPRLVNTLCDTAMMAAYSADRGVVTSADIASALEELQWAEYAARPHRHRPEQPTAALRAAAAHAGARVLGHLLVAADGRTVQEVPLRLGRLIIGRTPDNDVQIDSRFISRHHCQVITTLHSCVVEDLNSTNGIYVKSNRVRRHYLNDGDVVLVGKHELIYVDERAGRHRASLTDNLPALAAKPGEAAVEAAEPDEADEADEAAEADDPDLEATGPG